MIFSNCLIPRSLISFLIHIFFLWLLYFCPLIFNSQIIIINNLQIFNYSYFQILQFQRSLITSLIHIFFFSLICFCTLISNSQIINYLFDSYILFSDFSASAPLISNSQIIIINNLQIFNYSYFQILQFQRSLIISLIHIFFFWLICFCPTYFQFPDY